MLEIVLEVKRRTPLQYQQKHNMLFETIYEHIGLDSSVSDYEPCESGLSFNSVIERTFEVCSKFDTQASV